MNYDVKLDKMKLGDIASFGKETVQENQEGSLARALKPAGGNAEIDVVSKYKWTLSNITDSDQVAEIPYIRLVEYKCLESSIRKQFDFYAKGYLPDVVGNNTPGLAKKKQGVLDDYKIIWPRDNPTGFTYKFPYFNKTGQELTTEPWQSLDAVGGAIKDIAGGIGKLLPKGLREGIDKAAAVGELVKDLANASMNMQYPSVGVVDRPKIFMAHNDRNINVSVTLFNTVHENDWKANKALIYLLMSQNLFNKRDFTTGIPPVFYEVYIPGQYYSFASCVTNLKADHLGNQRLLVDQDEEFIVPDAYQLDFTLTELVKPSKNQYEALTTGEARNNVTVVTQQNI